MKKTIFCSGSMGGTSNLIYAALHPEDVRGLVIHGAATDLSSYYRWCETQKQPIIHEIAEAIRNSYGGTPDEKPDLYLRHSALAIFSSENVLAFRRCLAAVILCLCRIERGFSVKIDERPFAAV
jgi:pimeloyl-ACP methyl ester carboxylesterase